MIKNTILILISTFSIQCYAIELVCKGRNPMFGDAQRIAYVDCTDAKAVISNLYAAWQAVRKLGKNGGQIYNDDHCFDPYKQAKEFAEKEFTSFELFAPAWFLDCNRPLQYVK